MGECCYCVRNHCSGMYDFAFLADQISMPHPPTLKKLKLAVIAIVYFTFRATCTSEALQYIQLLTECSNTASVASGTCFAVGSSMAAVAGIDEVSKWWAGVMGVGAYWLNGDDSSAERLYPIVDNFPKPLQNTE